MSHLNKPSDAFNAEAAEKADVLIIGAGISGLTSAARILELAKEQGLPLPRIVIVEADSDIGGRARSAFMNGFVINPGAQWMHDSSGNPFYCWLSKQYPDLTFNEDHVSHGLIVTESGIKGPEFFENLSRAIYEAQAAAKEANPDQDLSMAALTALISDPDAARLAKFMAREWTGIQDPANISSDEALSDGYNPGGPQIEQGTTAAIEKMAADLKAQGVIIRTSTPVAIVEQTADSVTLKTADGKLLTAPAGICTVSAGVLQKKTITFIPAPSPEVNDYVDSLVMGHMTKVIVPLDKGFLEERGIKPNTFVSIIKDDMTMLCHMRSMGAPIVTIFAGGAASEATELASPEGVKTFINSVFSQLGTLMEGYEAAMAGEPYVSDFTTNPRTYGAYSTIRPGVKRSDPILQDRLIFSGEAFVVTDEHGKDPSGTMSAAWSAGRLAAQSALTLIEPGLEKRTTAAPANQAGKPPKSVL